MATDVQTPPDEASMTSLMRGIINDLGNLIRQEVRFAQTEIKADLRKTQQAAMLVGVGSALAVVGAILFAFMVAHLLYWLSWPAGTETSGLPLWGAYGIVSVVLLGIGSVVAWVGCQKFQSFNPLPDQTAQTVKENVEWITNSK